MADNEIRIIVEHVVRNEGGSMPTGQTVASTPLPTDVKGSTNALSQQRIRMGVEFGGRFMSTQFVLGQVGRVVSATGNPEIATGIETVGRYTFLGIRALSGDPIAIASLSMDMISRVLQEFSDSAKSQNETDETRIRYGLMNMNGVRMNKGFLFGRYNYTREG
jgi:hypothetical protein